MPGRLGRHGSLVFLRDGGRLTAIRDERHRKEPIAFRERTLPRSASGEPTVSFLGRSFTAAFAEIGHVAPRYEQLNTALARLHPSFALAPGSYEEDESSPSALEGSPSRKLHYHELDRTASALLAVTIVVFEHFVYEIECDAVIDGDRSFKLPDETWLWIASEQAPCQEQGVLHFDLEPGTHELLIVVWSKPSVELLHAVSLVCSRSDAWLAAHARSRTGRLLLPTFPVDTLDEARETVRAIEDLGRGTVLATRPEIIAQLRSLGADDSRLRLAAEPAALSRALSERPAVDTEPIEPSCSDPAGWLARVLHVTFGEDSAVDPDAVICDSHDPIVRILAVSYAHAIGAQLHVLDTHGEQPIPSPLWGRLPVPTWAREIRRYREQLASQVQRIVPERLRRGRVRQVTAFTQGFAWTLVETPDGPWAQTVDIGAVPERDAPWLLIRALLLAQTIPTAFSSTIVCDALLEKDKQETEAAHVQSTTVRTVAQPLMISGRFATAASISALASRLSVELMVLICHGEGDHVQLADGPLTSRRIAAWKLSAAPLVLNNSCASWATTGAAFVQAGARAYIGTLWPVRHASAIAVSNTLLDHMTARSDSSLGRSLSATVAAHAAVELDDALAYVLVGLPRTPARLAPLIDREQESDLAEFGLRKAYEVASDLVRNNQAELALVVWSGVCRRLAEHLERHIFEHAIPGFLRVSNLEGEHLPSLVTTHDADLWRMLFQYTGEKATPGGLEQVIELHNAAVELWQTGHERVSRRLDQAPSPDHGIGVQEYRSGIIPAILSSLVPLLVRAGAWERAWTFARRAAAGVLRPAKAVPSGPPKEIGVEEVIRAALRFRGPDDVLNALGIASLHQGRLEDAKRLYVAALGLLEKAPDDGQSGRIHSNLAQVLEREGHVDEAEAQFSEARRVLDRANDPWNALVTTLNLGRLYLSNGRLDRASALADEAELRAMRLPPSSPARQAYCDAAGFKASVLATLGRVDSAEAVSLTSLDGGPSDGPAPNRLMCAFACLSDQRVVSDPEGCAITTERIHRRAVAVGESAVAWKALLLTANLLAKAIQKRGDARRLRRLIPMAIETIGLEPSFNEFEPEMKAGVFEFLVTNSSAFAAVLKAPELLQYFHALQFLEPGEQRWDRAVELLKSTDQSLPHDPGGAALVWTRAATVEIHPPDRTSTIITDAPPRILERPLYMRFPVSHERVQSVDAHVEGADVWSLLGRALYHRCDGDEVRLFINKRGLVRLVEDRFIRYEEVWGSTHLDYDVTIVLPAPAIPIALGFRPLVRTLRRPSFSVLRRRDNMALRVVGDPASTIPAGFDSLLGSDEVPQMPRDLLSSGWLGRLTVDFAPYPDLYATGLRLLKDHGSMDFSDWIEALNRMHRG